MNMQYMERFMNMAHEVIGTDESILVVVSGGNYCLYGVYKIEENVTKNNNEALATHPDHDELKWGGFEHFEKGIHLYRFSKGECIEQRYISHFVPETYCAGASELAIYQEYGLEPASDYQKRWLEDALKAEKIKNTLVWACYINDKEKIQEFIENPKLTVSQLNKVLKLAGTPLIICAKHDNLESFKALVEKGADLSKKISGEGTPLMTAFRFSYDIVKYIFDNHREQFDKEVKDFYCAGVSEDIRIYELIKSLGFDFCCEGQKYPLLHSCAQSKNIVGLKFLLDNGVDIELKNGFGMTALECAEREDNIEIVEFLKNYQKQ